MAKQPFMNKTILKEYGLKMASQQSNPAWRNAFNIYLDYLVRILFNLYVWEGLPDSMDSDFLERCLMEDGLAGMVDHNLYGHINTRATWGELGIYNKPITSTFYNLHINFEVMVGKNSGNAVLVFNNNQYRGYMMIAIFYAERMADYAITHDINILAQRTPVTLMGDYSQMEQLSQAYAAYVGGSPVIGRRKANSKTTEELGYEISALKTDAPFVADKVYGQFTSILNEFFAMVGINFVNNNKQERMLKDEVNANNQQIQISYTAGLKTRREAVEQYNKIHGTSITVDINQSIGEIINAGFNISSNWEGQIPEINGELSDT